jgi:WhiB family redox-sensing transcriptional regulator
MNIDTPAWLDDAICASIDPSLFFPAQGESVKPAKAICASCDARIACLAWAMEAEIQHGIYGGVTARERRNLRNAA